jgi:hypothetical protein
MPIAWNFFNTPVHVHTTDRNRDTNTRFQGPKYIWDSWAGSNTCLCLYPPPGATELLPPIALSPRSRDSPPCETLRPTPGGGSRTLTENLLLRHALDADLLHRPLCKFGLDDGLKVGVRALAYQKPQRGVKPLEKLVVVLDDGPVACGRLMVSPRGDGLPGGKRGKDGLGNAGRAASQRRDLTLAGVSLPCLPGT